MHKTELEILRDRAIAVLKENDLGVSTKPSPRLYPHQWNWDSGLIAIGISRVDEKRAQDEILSLLRGQWHNGMIPHIIFNPAASDYDPGPGFWDSSLSDDAPKHIQTSGITQPPILAYCALELYKNSSSTERAREFLARVYPGLKDYHRFLLNERDKVGEGLACIVHPWESGLDNSPRWDEALMRVVPQFVPEYSRADTSLVPASQRPTNEEYDKYTYLVALFRRLAYDPDSVWRESPFLVQPILFNCIMYASLEALAEIGGVLDEDISEVKGWMVKTRNAINSKLWHERTGSYVDYDLRSGKSVIRNTVARFAPLFAGITSPKRAESIVASLMSPEEYWPRGGYPLCSVSKTEPSFDPVRYWRGPAWVNVNWMMVKGLEKYGYHPEAARLVRRTLQLLSEQGFYEYFNPYSGQGLGTDSFSWSAALAIDLIASYEGQL